MQAKADGVSMAWAAFDRVRDVFEISGAPMRTHAGRSVVVLTLENRTHYLKRFWLAPSQLLKRPVARGFHELRMIDWLNGNGFAGPRVVRRGWSRVGPVVTRLYFLMKAVPDEWPIEAAWRRFPERADGLVRALAVFAARLHDAGFTHTDFSERHILAGLGATTPRAVQKESAAAGDEGWSFRLIDVERATIGRRSHPREAADLATLAASTADESLRARIESDFLKAYLEHRSTISPEVDFAALVARARPTRSFH